MKLQVNPSKFLLLLLLTGAYKLSDGQALLVASANGSTQSINLSAIESIVFTNNNLVVHHADCEDAHFSVFFTDYLTLDGSLSTADQSSATRHLQVYPNPASDQIVVETTGIGETLTIWSAQGQIVHSRTMNSTRESIDITALPSGLYLIRVKNQTIQFVKP